jgi:hypothetical protein
MSTKNKTLARWSEAAYTALTAIEELVALQADFRAKLDNLPVQRLGSEYAEMLTAVVDLELEHAEETIQEAAYLYLELP